MTPAETASMTKLLTTLIVFALLGLLSALAIVVEFLRDRSSTRVDPVSGFTIGVAIVISISVFALLNTDATP